MGAATPDSFYTNPKIPDDVHGFSALLSEYSIKADAAVSSSEVIRDCSNNNTNNSLNCSNSDFGAASATSSDRVAASDDVIQSAFVVCIAVFVSYTYAVCTLH